MKIYTEQTIRNWIMETFWMEEQCDWVDGDYNRYFTIYYGSPEHDESLTNAEICDVLLAEIDRITEREK